MNEGGEKSRSGRIIVNNKSGKFETQKCNQIQNIFLFTNWRKKNPKNEQHQPKSIPVPVHGKDKRYRICSCIESKKVKILNYSMWLRESRLFLQDFITCLQI